MDEILDILKKWNPWEKKLQTGIKRKEYVEKIISFIDRKEVIVLKGIRRSGKSTLLRQAIAELIKKGIDKKQILYINLEDYGFADKLNIGLFDEILETYKQYAKNRKKIYLFIDEVQKIGSWEKWVRTKYDLGENIKFIVTGSSASLLSRELSALLTGRNISFTVMPLSFREFVFFTGKDDLEDYMLYGGFPEVVLERSEEKKKVLLQQYFEDIIHKDIVDRHDIRNAKQIFDLARYLVSASGSKVSINKLSKIFGISKDTLAAYISYMIDACLLAEVTYFSYSAKVKHDISKLPKLYSLDNGFINIVSMKYSKNIGQMFENAVFIKIFEDYKEISYWSELESEVDFIFDKTALNVTSQDEIHEREFRGLNDFKKKHRNFSSFIVSKSLEKDGIMPIIKFLKG
jgi:predicted AAA+ superfamily ATPase